MITRLTSRLSRLSRRTIILLAAAMVLVGLFALVAVRTGPFAPVPITVITVETQALRPRLFGLGTVDAHRTAHVGPTTAGRLRRVLVDVGDTVAMGQLVAELEPVDLDAKVQAQDESVARARTLWHDARDRREHAANEARRHEALLDAGSSTAELVASRALEARSAERAEAAALADLRRLEAEQRASRTQRAHLRLFASSGGIVSARFADPGSTIVPGQSVLDIVDPDSLWVTVRFDQQQAAGLTSGLEATVHRRAVLDTTLRGRVARLEPKADVVTEELLARVAFSAPPRPSPAVGELVEVTVQLPAVAASPVVPNAAIHRRDGVHGVWTLTNGSLHFVPVRLGVADLDGHVQVLEGLAPGDAVVVHSRRPLTERSRVSVQTTLAGGVP